MAKRFHNWFRIAIDLIGANGTRVVSQLSANSLFHGVTEVDAPNITLGGSTKRI